MNLQYLLALAVFALMAGAAVERAKADVTILCDDGRVVTIASGETASRDSLIACARMQRRLTAHPLLPTRNPGRQPTAQTAAAPIITGSLRATGRRQPASKPNVAGNDAGSFRRVRVINARTPETRWYIHVD